MTARDDLPSPFPATAGARNAWVLAVCQGLFTAAISTDLTLTGLAGYQLAPVKSLATLPFAMITVAGAAVTLFASLLMQRIGRRWGFVLGAGVCAVGGLVSVWSVVHRDFWLFCLGTAAVGVFQAFAQYYRLAAADSVHDEAKARAISTVLAGGVVAAVLGPALAAWSSRLFPVLFAGSYLMVAGLGLASALLLALAYRDVEPTHAVVDGSDAIPRPMQDIARQPMFLAAIANIVLGSAVMMLVMTAAPLAAVASHHSIGDGANIIQWHLVGMYAPSLFAGRLIRRAGTAPVIFTGMALCLGCGVIAMTSTDLVAFYAALFFLGVGWNFMFIGGTALLARCYRPAERGRVQGASEMVRYTVTALATLAAGPMLEGYGWAGVNLAILPLLLIAALATSAWVRSESRVLVSAADA